jgi:hypothetical protein
MCFAVVGLNLDDWNISRGAWFKPPHVQSSFFPPKVKLWGW